MGRPLVWLLSVFVVYFYTMTDFEFDSEKSDSNRLKYGIDFIEAQLLWDDPLLLEIPAKTADEPRCLVIGLIGLTHWSAVITYRALRCDSTPFAAHALKS